MSELTVPRAPNIVGRTANEQFEAPEAGAAVAQFGNRMLQFGTALEADRLDRQMSRLRVDMTKDLGELRLQVEEIGDPEAAGAAWDQGIARLRQTYQTGTDERGRPRIDKKNAENFGLAFDDLSNTHALALGGRFLALRQSQRAATYYEYSTVAGDQAAKADPATRDKLYADFDEETDRQVAAGTMDPERAAKAKTEFRQRTENAAAIELQAADPQGLIEALDGDEFANLDPETRARYGVSAQAEVDRRAAAEQKAAEAGAKETAAQIDKDLGKLIDLSDHGGAIAVDQAFLARPDVQASPRYAEAQAALALRQEVPDLAFKTPAELDTLIAAEKARPIREPWEEKRLTVLEAQRERAADGLRTDPMAYAKKSGLPVPALPAFDPANPDAFADAVAARVTFGQGLKSEGYTADAVILDQDEQAAITKTFAGMTDPAAKAALAGALTGAVLERKGDPRQIAALAADPVLSWVGGMQARGAGSPALAAEIVSGEQAMEAKNLILPPAADRLAPTFEQLGTVFADLPGGEAQQASVMAAADALYAARVRRIDPTGAIDEDLYRQVLHEVMGGSGQMGSSNARGGLQEVNGRLTLLDPGIRADDVEAAALGLRRHLTVEEGGFGSGVIAATTKLPETSNAALLRSSVSGGLPTINGEPLTASDLAGASFVALGPDQYVMVLSIGGGANAVDSQTGREFVFSMKKLLREYGP